MSFNIENATLEDLIDRAMRPTMYAKLIERLTDAIKTNQTAVLALLDSEPYRTKFAKAAALHESNSFNLFVKLFGDRLEDVLSIHGWMIDRFVPVDKRKETVVALFKAAPPFCDCLSTLREHLTDREIIALIRDTLRTCDVKSDAIRPDRTFQGGRDFIVTFLNPPAVKLADPNNTWREDNSTWWSLFSRREFIELLDLCNKRRPGTLLAHRRTGLDWTSHELVGAYLAHIGASPTMNRLVDTAFHTIADPDLFIELPLEEQERLIRDHKGGNIFLLIKVAIALDSIRLFRYYGSDLMKSMPGHLIAGIFEGDRKALNVAGEVTGEISNTLRLALQRAGFVIATLDYTGADPLVQIADIKYHPKFSTQNHSDLREARAPHVRVEVAFDPTEYEPSWHNSRVVKMYHIA